MTDANSELMFPNEVPPNTKIARYMGLAQYLALLESQEAYFPSVAQLRGAEGNKGDKNEGRLSPVDRLFMDGSAAIFSHAMNNWPTAQENVRRIQLGSPPSDPKRVPPPPTVEIYPVLTPFGVIHPEDGLTHDDIYERVSNWIDVWCWHEFGHERISMWRQYGQGEGAICIISSAENLLASLSPTEGDVIKFFPASYRDWFGVPNGQESNYRIACEKSKVYADEREVRLVVHDTNCDPMSTREKQGRKMAVDLKRLCQKIVVHPDSPDWAFDAIDMLTKRHLDIGASRSEIYDERAPW